MRGPGIFYNTLRNNLDPEPKPLPSPVSLRIFHCVDRYPETNPELNFNHYPDIIAQMFSI